ncbi:DUF4365 domain-containing protein [Rhizobium paranaense]|uniref:DUF4365 domain-containing protein n=1 Tax=Rhizobium paranaense TaxID=1650438 RepID=A0A7W8XWH5_9HYPH|nr:DUF4365 domain-containing protein [Rhizobium paranaense]MBB5576675.1 hypothetical protein [Rhizobium paranaense]
MTGRLQAVILAIVAAVTAMYRLFVTAGPEELPRRRQRVMSLSAFHADPAICAAIDAVEQVFIQDFKWSFRRLSYPQESGIDARAEILDNGWSTGRFLPMRIWPAPSEKDDSGNYLHQLERRSVDYWASHCLSVCVFLFDPDRHCVMWQWVNSESCSKSGEEWLLAVPSSNILDGSARLSFEEGISLDSELLLRSAFALDRFLMERIGHQTAIFIWDEWGDFSPIFCNLRVFLANSEPEMQVDYRIRARSLHELMTQLFPWARYSYAEPIKEYSGEVAVHVLEIEVRPEALAYLRAEEFLEVGYPEEQAPPSPESEGYITAEEEAAFWRGRGVSRGSDERDN